MRITKNINETKAVITLDGTLNVESSPVLARVIDELGDEVTSLAIDAKGLEYITSAGLRVFVSAHKKMREHGGLTILNPTNEVLSILKMTGYATQFKIEVDA